MALLELCLIEDVTEYPGRRDQIPPEDHEWIAAAIRGLSRRIEKATGRALNKEARTVDVVPSSGGSVIQLPAFGDASSAVSEVKESYDGTSLATATALAATSYTFEPSTGLLHRIASRWPVRPYPTVRVTYDAGLASTTLGVPEDLRFAVARQVMAWYLRRDDLGITSRVVQSQGSTTIERSALSLLDDVQADIAAYRLIAV